MKVLTNVHENIFTHRRIKICEIYRGNVHKRFLVYLALRLMLPLFIQAQGRFMPGYIVTNAGDTVYCELMNPGREESSMDYIYKIPVKDSLIKVSPYHVRAFGTYDGKKFIRAKAIVEISDNRIYQAADTAKGLVWEERFLFLQVLAEGKSATLYYYFDDGRDLFYFKTDTTHIIPLIYKKYSIEPTPNVPEGYIINNTFRDQLAYYLSCGDTPEKAKRLYYTKKSLMDYFSEYYHCRGETFKEYSKIARGWFHIRAVLIGDLSTLRIEDGVTAFYRFPADMNPGAGLELEYVFGYNRGKWSLFLEGNYHHFNVTDATYSLGTEVPPSRVIYNSIDIPAGISYSFILNSYNRFFLKVAVDPEFILKSSYVTFNVNNPAAGEPLTPTTGVVLGGGYRYRFISIEARIRSAKNITRNIYLHKSILRIYSLRLAFSFF